MATPTPTPAQAFARKVYYFLTLIAPEILLPKRTTSTSTQTSTQTASKSTQVSELDLPSSARARRSPSGPNRIPRSTKKLNLNSVQGSRVTKRWGNPPKRVTKCKGLYNRENSCYMNSLLQCLFNIPEFVGYLDGLHNESECSQKDAGLCVVCALKAVLQAYTDTKVSKIPQYKNLGLEEVIKRRLASSDNHELSEFIKRDRQGDPYVYLHYLLTQLEACEQPTDDPKSAEMFKIATRTQWTCNECGNVKSAEVESSASGLGVGLSLNIQMPKRGMTMLSYMRRNEFETKLQVRCESEPCIKKHGKDSAGFKRTRTKRITKAPEILVIQFERATMDEAGEQIKLKDEVEFEEYVNLGEFTESEAPIMYQLQGVVAHMGDSLRGGHWIAAVREPNGKRFCSINDQVDIGHAWNGNVHELQWPKSMKGDFNPSVLFYTKL